MQAIQAQNHAYFRAIWEGQLVTIPGDRIPVALPQPTMHFLETVGLPAQDDQFFRNVRFAGFTGQFSVIHFLGSDYFVIARIFFEKLQTYILFGLHSPTGHLFQLATQFDDLKPTSSRPVSFVNSSIYQFLASLVTYRHLQPAVEILIEEFYRAHVPHMNNQEELAVGDAIQMEMSWVIQTFRDRLLEIDARALDDPYDFWLEALASFDYL